MTLTRNLILIVVALLCFAAGWFIAAGHSLFGTDTEWLFAGLIAFVGAHLPNERTP
jgi:hypothetical protein